MSLTFGVHRHKLHQAVQRHPRRTVEHRHVEQVGCHARACATRDAVYAGDDAVVLPREVVGVVVRHAHRVAPAVLEHLVEEREGERLATWKPRDTHSLRPGEGLA